MCDEKIRLYLGANEENGVFEFGEGAHVGAALASLPPSCNYVEVRYDHIGYDEAIDEQIAFHKSISSETEAYFQPLNYPNSHTLSGTVRESTTHIHNEEGTAACKIKKIFRKISKPYFGSATELLAKGLNDDYSSKKIGIWIRLSNGAGNQRRDLSPLAFQKICNNLPPDVKPVALGHEPKDHRKEDWTIHVPDLRNIWNQADYRQNPLYARNLAIHYVLKEKFNLAGVIGMQCGGTDLMAFAGIDFASITRSRNKNERVPDERMRLLSEIFPNFKNVVYLENEYDAVKGPSILPEHSMEEIRELANSWI